MAFLPSLPLLGNLEISGTTRQGMSFTGRLVEVVQETLHLKVTGKKEDSLYGIPLANLSTVSANLPEGPGREGREMVEQLFPVASLWDRPSAERFLGWCHGMEEKKKWIRLHRWTSELAGVLPYSELDLELHLLLATSMKELGLWQQLETILDDLNAGFPPMLAPHRLCWLNASLASRQGNSSRALFWTRLPRFQLPRRETAFTERLRSLESRLTDKENESPSLEP